MHGSPLCLTQTQWRSWGNGRNIFIHRCLSGYSFHPAPTTNVCAAAAWVQNCTICKFNCFFNVLRNWQVCIPQMLHKNISQTRASLKTLCILIKTSLWCCSSSTSTGWDEILKCSTSVPVLSLQKLK